jgi:hypothetical protein
VVTKNLGGRPERQFTDKDRAFVRAMAMAGAQHERIAEVVGCTAKTLRKHFRVELDHGRDQANANVVANLYRQATKDDPRATVAAIYWTKAQMGWREAARTEVTGADGNPVKIEIGWIKD